MSVAQEHSGGGETGPGLESDQQRNAGFVAQRHRRGNHPIAMLALAAFVGLIVASIQMLDVQSYFQGSWFSGLTTDVVQWVFLGSVTLLALEYLTGRLGILWSDGSRTTEFDASNTDRRNVVIVAVVFGMLGVLISPGLNQLFIDIIVASVALHVAFLYVVSRKEGGDEEIPWSGLVVDRVRFERGRTILRLKNVSDVSVDLREKEIEDGFGNHHTLGGNVVLKEGRTEVFGFDADEEFRPEPGQHLLLHAGDEVRTVLWEEPEPEARQ